MCARPEGEVRFHKLSYSESVDEAAPRRKCYIRNRARCQERLEIHVSR